jgi:hypothetical protein
MPVHHAHLKPSVGSWYEAIGASDSFAVVNYDKNDIQIQYSDGELAEIDYDTWDELDPEQIAEPDDATAPYGLEHDEDIIKLLNEIEEQGDLDEHLHNLDRDETDWD